METFHQSRPAPAGYDGDAGMEEWRSRIDLANAYRIVAKLGADDFGWTHVVYNHITLKLPVCARDGPLFLINAFGCRFDEVTPESLHTIDLEGRIVRRGIGISGVRDRGVLIAGFTIHSAVHAAREDVRAIFHTHHPDVVAVSALKCGLLPCSNEGCLSLALLSPKRHDFEGTATDDSEKQRIADALGPTAMTLLLNNHGVVCCGSTLHAALRTIWVFTKACTYQVRALAAAGGDADRLVLPSQAVVDACMAREMKQQKDPLGEVEFDAWLRGPAI
jgi:ribulose-5-phosphate 4-epimerase/fuculose-1-phosphate aldolase